MFSSIIPRWSGPECAALLQLLDDLEQMADRTGEAVEAHDDEDIANGDLAQ